MGIFGFSLPPGCGRLPGEEPKGPCEVCGRYSEHCICPECPECGEVGNPACYADHGLKVTKAQEEALAASTAAQESLMAADEEFWGQYESGMMPQDRKKRCAMYMTPWHVTSECPVCSQ